MPRIPIDVEHVSETDVDIITDDDDDDNENDENTPPNVDHIPPVVTPLSHARSSHDVLRDITDQFFHPPSPSPVRISKRTVPGTVDPPRRPKKPKSLAFPADPPNWLYSRSSPSLPPSSPFQFPPSTTSIDHARFTDRATTARHEYNLGTPTRASDSDPFGFIAVERALRAKRATAPTPLRISAIKSPPRSTVPSVPLFASLSHLDPIPTNNEDIDGLYADEPVAGPSHVPAAPLLLMNSDQPFAELDPQPTFPDPLRTPRKRKRRGGSPAPDGDLDADQDGTDTPSSPSPVKVSRRPVARASHAPLAKLTRAQARAAAAAAGTPEPARTRRVRAHQHIPTPSLTRSASQRQSTAPPTPVQPRRSTRQAAVGARAKLKGTNDGENKDSDRGRMTLRSRGAKTGGEAKTAKRMSKASTKTQKAAATVKPARGRPRGKTSKNTKGKGKARPLESVLDLSDDTRERYETERRERLEYFKRLEGYQIQKENVYVI